MASTHEKIGNMPAVHCLFGDLLYSIFSANRLEQCILCYRLTGFSVIQKEKKIANVTETITNKHTHNTYIALKTLNSFNLILFIVAFLVIKNKNY